MSDNEQLSLEAEQGVQQPVQPDEELLDLRDPTLTEEQDRQYDKLVDHGGLTREQALARIGALPVSQTQADEPTVTSRQGSIPPTTVGPIIVDPGSNLSLRNGHWKNDA